MMPVNSKNLDWIESNPNGDFAKLAQAAPSLFEQGRSLLFNAKDRFQYADAASLLEQAVTEEDASASANFALAYAYLKRGNYAGASEQAGFETGSILNVDGGYAAM